MNITEQQLINKAKELIVTRWTYSHCESCEYPRHFIFDSKGVKHDEGCTCIDVERARQRYMPSSYSVVIAIMNSLTEDDLKAAIKFWRL